MKKKNRYRSSHGGFNHGIDDEWFGEEEIEVHNPLEIKLWVGCQVIAHWNATEEQWEVIAATSNKVVMVFVAKIASSINWTGAQDGNEWDEGSEARMGPLASTTTIAR